MAISSDFWEFSLEVYGRQNVAGLCLELQDKVGADVNIVLFLLWLGRQKLALKEGAGIDLILDCVAPWHKQIVQSMRTARREMKNWPVPDEGFRDRLRADIQKLEIRSEQIEQSMLYELFETQSKEFIISSNQTEETLMQENLSQYLTRLSDASLDAQQKILVGICL